LFTLLKIFVGLKIISTQGGGYSHQTMFTEKACLIAGSLTFFAWGAALQKPLRKSKANHHDQLFADGDPSRSVNSTCDLSHSGLPDFVN
jgi:hypothetical protein